MPNPDMELTVGPNPFLWDSARLRAFHNDLAEAPVARVVLGEFVCSKRQPFLQEEFTRAIGMMQDAGKEVALTTLALITLERDRAMTAELGARVLPVEVNDISALRHIPQGRSFWVGPLVNVYNEGTLRWLAARGAVRICLPPELPQTSVEVLAALASELGVALEVWGHGRVPLAISGRCYHARLHGRRKDNCRFVCAEDPDGREVDTIDGQRFLAVNGVQTLSDTTACTAHQMPALQAAGVNALRLSPQSGDFRAICSEYAALLGGRTTPDAMTREIAKHVPGGRLSDGFARGEAGAGWSG